MKITNKYKLPLPLVQAVVHDPYSKGDSDFSVTGLLAPPRLSVLQKKHDKQITQDVTDMLWSLLGQIGHAVLQKGAHGDIVEKRFFAELMGYKISGQVDYGIDKTIHDFKFVSIFVTKNGAKPEWVKQLNCYRWLCAQNGIQIDKLQITAIYRDWRKNEAGRDPSYPQSHAQSFDLPVWSLPATEQFIKDRLAMHVAARKKLPLCSAEDRWAKDDSWALYKRGGKRALRVFFNKAVAGAELNKAGAKLHEIQFRPGESTRCESWCPVAPFCDQFKALKASQKTSLSATASNPVGRRVPARRA